MKNKEEHENHLKTRKKISDISSLKDFESLLNQTTLSSIDKEILRLKYIEDLNFINIGEKLGFTEQAVKKRHKKSLKKISSMI